jgi:hypothetical protein
MSVTPWAQASSIPGQSHRHTGYWLAQPYRIPDSGRNREGTSEPVGSGENRSAPLTIRLPGLFDHDVAKAEETVAKIDRKLAGESPSSTR